MKIFYFRKKALRWVFIIVVAIILILILTKVFGGQNPSQSTLMTAQLCSRIGRPMFT